MRGAGRVVFAATLLLIVGGLNIIYGIGALDGARIVVDDQRYILDDANTLGWCWSSSARSSSWAPSR